jgi:DNA-binding transcriptional regulator GbsR (MarR family)
LYQFKLISQFDQTGRAEPGNEPMSSDSKVEEVFIERMGAALEAQGLPRLAGQIFGLLMLADEPLTLEEIAERLQISGGSTSANTRLLESLDLVERFTPRGERRVRHRVHDDPLPRLLVGMIARIGKVSSIIRDGRTQLDAGRRATVKRLKRTEEAFDLFMESLRELLEQQRGRE